MSSRNPLQPGQRFGGNDGQRFEVIARVGVGGQAVVYKAVDTRLGRDVAAKVSTAAGVGDRQVARERFERELQLTARVSHPHILQVYDCGEIADGSPFVLLEWMANGALSDLLERCKKSNAHLPLPFVHYYATALAAAMRAVHATQMIHRDLKPENVLIGADGVAKLTDFGIAKDISPSAVQLTEVGQTLGTLGFMSPEQLSGLPGPQSDIFSYGVTVYAILMGRMPDQVTQNAIPLGRLTDQAWVGVPEPYQSFIKLCTRFELDSRAQDFDQVLSELRAMRLGADTREVISPSRLPPLPSGAFVTGDSPAGGPIPLPRTETSQVAVETGSAPGVTRYFPSDDLAAPRKSRAPLAAAIVVLLGLAGGGAALLGKEKLPAPADVVSAAVRYEQALAMGDADGAKAAVQRLPAGVAEMDEGRLILAVDALAAGDANKARGEARALGSLPGAGGALAGLIEGAASRLSGAGGYGDAVTAYTRVAACSAPDCGPLLEHARTALADACLVVPPGTAGCGGFPGPQDPRDRQLARSLVLRSDGHRDDALAALRTGLATPLAGTPSCLEAEALRRWASAPGDLPGDLKGTVAVAGKAAARDGAACALFGGLGS